LKTCKQCQSLYDNIASYCNVCDIDLTEDITEKTTVKLAEDVRLTLGKAKKTIMSIHKLLGSLQVLLIVFIATVFFTEGEQVDGVIAVLVLMIFPVAHFVTAWGVKHNKQWSHLVSTIIGFILLLGFPVGTILGFFLLKNLFRKEWNLLES
jgi:hypothetical protein